MYDDVIIATTIRNTIWQKAGSIHRIPTSVLEILWHSWVSCGPTFQLHGSQYFWCPSAGYGFM